MNIIFFAPDRYDKVTMERFRELFTSIAAVLARCDDENHITVERLRSEIEKSSEESR